MLRAFHTCLLGFLGLLTSVRGNVIVYTQAIPHTIMDEFHDMPASFGPDLPPDGLRGYLVVGEPRDGCSPLNKPPVDTDNFTGKWVVLVARYNCSFEQKIRNAQTAGYDCAIVHNVNSSELETMSAKDAEGIVIPSVFIGDVAGDILSDLYVYPKQFYIMVNGDLPFNINTHLLLPFAVVVALCLIIILIVLIVKCIKDRRRARRHRLPNRSLKKIPTCKFSKGDPYETCAICLDDYQDGERLRVLPCAHAYHAKCIDPWLTQNRRVCPVCKRRVMAAGERRAPPDSDTDDTEPLLANSPPATQGGTFEEQRENPLVRAARYISRMQSRIRTREGDAEVAQPSEENNENVDNDETHDTQPLLRAAEPERRRRGRRTRRSLSAPRTPSHHSINGTPADDNAPIGVAALPAPPADTGVHVINL